MNSNFPCISVALLGREICLTWVWVWLHESASLTQQLMQHWSVIVLRNAPLATALYPLLWTFLHTQTRLVKSNQSYTLLRSLQYIMKIYDGNRGLLSALLMRPADKSATQLNSTCAFWCKLCFSVGTQATSSLKCFNTAGKCRTAWCNAVETFHWRETNCTDAFSDGVPSAAASHFGLDRKEAMHQLLMWKIPDWGNWSLL